MSARRQQLFNYAHCVAGFDRIVNALLRHADAPFAESLEHIRFLHALETFKGEVTNNRQLFDFENDVYTAARPVLNQHARQGLVEESQRKERLVVALDLIDVVNVAGPRLNVVKNVVFTQTPIASNVDAFDESLGRLRLLGYDTSRCK